jgi:hypothetical protein
MNFPTASSTAASVGRLQQRALQIAIDNDELAADPELEMWSTIWELQHQVKQLTERVQALEGGLFSVPPPAFVHPDPAATIIASPDRSY